jgi:TonB family protein
VHPKTLMAAFALTLPAFALVPRLHAQDVTVTPPRVLAQPAPDYPLGMRASGMRGDVLVDFVVDSEGRVTRAYVVRSLNPAFDEPALEAVRRWKFEPGRKGGVPINTHMQVPIHFQLEGEWEGGNPGLNVQHQAKQADLPEEFRYDTPPKPRGRVEPVYPYAMLRDEVKGEATVSFIISEKGRVVAASVNQASRPEFGAATVAMVEQWEFEPALKAGRPTRSSFAFTQEFSRSDRILMPYAVDDMLTLERKHPERIVSAGKLDQPLKPVSTRPPVFPVTVPESVNQGEAVVEILIDRDGRVWLPRVVSASEPAFGWAAVQAVAMWQFEPPTRQGQTIVTRVRVPFEFKATPARQAEDKK